MTEDNQSSEMCLVKSKELLKRLIQHCETLTRSADIGAASKRQLRDLRRIHRGLSMDEDAPDVRVVATLEEMYQVMAPLLKRRPELRRRHRSWAVDVDAAYNVVMERKGSIQPDRDSNTIVIDADL